jgi:uncharacterized membrane protein (UPF0127 family)/CheY-like chemotaxis protein
MGTSEYIVNITRGSIVCESAVVADRPLRRMRGLLGRRSLPAGEGLLLTPAPSIHTALMRFPIDVIFLDKELRVLRLLERLRPWRAASARRARAALELAEGEIAQRSIQVGDTLALIDECDRAGTVDGRVDAAQSSYRFRGLIDGGQPAGGQRSDRATRVLLISNDRRFRTVAAALLNRRACSVTLGDRMENVVALAKRQAADVVILDASASLTAAAREAAQIESLKPAVGVVVVADDASSRLSTMPVLAKWQAFDHLHKAVVHATGRPHTRRSHA